jgi:hypothetical protein
MNMKKNGFCKESTGKGKAYDTKIHVKHAQIKPNEIIHKFVYITT